MTSIARGQSPALTFYVATNGDDRGPGTAQKPLATLGAAQEAVRNARRDGAKGPVRVLVRGGVYELDRPLLFRREDGGSEAAPVSYEAEPGQTVTLRGAKPVVGWKIWRDGIYVADLKAQGLGNAQFHQLFYRGQRQILARYPNFDPAHPHTGGFLYVEKPGPDADRQFIYAPGDLPLKRWGGLAGAEVCTVYAWGWTYACTPITGVDVARRLISVRPLRATFRPRNRFFVQNLLVLLDAPGEWYLDHEQALLYFYPPGKLRNGDVVVPVVDHLIEVRGTIPYPHGYLNVAYHGKRENFPMPKDAPPDAPVTDLTFKGLHLEDAEHDAIRLIGARRCAVIGCTVRNAGNVGINLGGVANAYPGLGNPRLTAPTGVPGGVGGAGQDLLFNDPCQDCRVIGNDVDAAGADGIFLYGTGNLAENNFVHDIGLFDKDCAAINAFGEKNVIRRNTMRDLPRNAVFLKGIDNTVELNRIDHTMLETCDGGAIRMCQRNPNLRGNVIRFNRITDTIGYGLPRGDSEYHSPYYAWGVYLDDFTCGTTVYGNIIARTGRGGVMVHGGSDCAIENNIIIDPASYMVEIVRIAPAPLRGTRVRGNIFVCLKSSPALYRIYQMAAGEASFSRNLVQMKDVNVILGDRDIHGWGNWIEEGLEKHSLCADPRFIGPADDGRLAKDSPAFGLGFKPIPIEQIGCYPDAQRASWPLR